jgi:hypothetical protein
VAPEMGDLRAFGACRSPLCTGSDAPSASPTSRSRGAIPTWRSTPSLPRSNTPTLQHSNTPALQHSNTPTLQHSNTPTLQHSNTPTLHHSITPSLHHSITPSLHHSITPSLHHSITPLLRAITTSALYGNAFVLDMGPNNLVEIRFGFEPEPTRARCI